MSDPTRRLMPVIRTAPAKLNLSLAIVGRRPDGFHTLHSVVVPLGLADRLSLAVTSAAADTVHVSGATVDWPPERDLVRRAIAAARDRVGPVAGGRPPALAARLDKRIPVAAGLGGGSSDAAAALDGAIEAWDAELVADERQRVAASLGSDVPFFLAGGPALLEGRGETVTPLKAPMGESVGVLLVTPAIAVPTATVFAAFAEQAAAAGRIGSGPTRQSSAHLADELRGGLAGPALVDRAGILATANDLIAATAAIVPAIVPFRRALFRLLGRPIGQSGSGPTLWALYPSLSAAEAGASVVREAVDTGVLTAPGDHRPFVHATVIESGGPT